MGGRCQRSVKVEIKLVTSSGLTSIFRDCSCGGAKLDGRRPVAKPSKKKKAGANEKEMKQRLAEKSFHEP